MNPNFQVCHTTPWSLSQLVSVTTTTVHTFSRAIIPQIFCQMYSTPLHNRRFRLPHPLPSKDSKRKLTAYVCLSYVFECIPSGIWCGVSCTYVQRSIHTRHNYPRHACMRVTVVGSVCLLLKVRNWERLSLKMLRCKAMVFDVVFLALMRYIHTRHKLSRFLIRKCLFCI